MVESTTKLPLHIKSQLVSLYNLAFPRVSPRIPRNIAWLDETSQKRVRFLLLNKSIVVSHAAVLTKNFRHADTQYLLAGFGGVMTHPDFRKKGFGSQIINRAARFIDKQNFDVAVLFCHRNHEVFYRRSGWEILANDDIFINEGTPIPQPQDELAMIRYISEKAIRNRERFENLPVYFGEAW